MKSLCILKSDVILFLFSDGIFEIRFLEDSQLEFDSMPNQIGPFLAVESMAYFEAYAHVLAGMKGISADGFPMADYIVR